MPKGRAGRPPIRSCPLPLNLVPGLPSGFPNASEAATTPVSTLPPFARGIIWMSGALLSFLMMAIAGRELSDTMNTFQIVLVRSVVALSVILVIVSYTGFGAMRTEKWRIHLIRNTIHYGAQFGWFLGISLLPLATVFAIEFTTPIWAVLMAVVFLKEKMTMGRTVAVGFGFIGVLIILRPGAEVFDIGSIAVLLAAMGYASAYTFTRFLGRTDSPLVILFHMMAVQTLIGLGPGLWVWVTPQPVDAIWVLLVGLMAISSHFCLAKALSLAEASVVVPIDFLRLPLIAVIGFLIYNEAIEIAVFAGALVIFAGNYYNIRQETKAAPS